LVNPQTTFEPNNIRIHKITAQHVVNAPTFKQLFPKLKIILENYVIVHHNHNDITAIREALNKNNLQLDKPITFLDILPLAKKYWRNVQSFGLEALAGAINFNFKHHDAGEDALATQAVFVHMLQENNLDDLGINYLVANYGKKIVLNACNEYEDCNEYKQVKKTKTNKIDNAVNVEINVNGKFFGKKIVFTGELSIPRAQAISNANKLGFHITSTVSTKTDIVCVGDTNNQHTTKLIKAYELINKGCNLKIINEDEFNVLLVNLS